MGHDFFGPTPAAEDLWFPEQATDTQQLFYESIAQFTREIMGPAEEPLATGDYALARNLFRECAELGVFAAELDEDDDGLGFGVLDATLLSEAIGRGHSLSGGLMVDQG
ncbi:MAG: acyl-CoA dehydrogenase family protein, partial [Candidatus Hydrogenedentes bacterium]|nr:acyl-CoA dehydrogenase family protein [Candidatus Hydrogenedentota bacterium]